MKTAALLAIIGEPIKSTVIVDLLGSVTLHSNGYVSGDPCYFEHAISGHNYHHIRSSIRQAYPWAGYCAAANSNWREFSLGHPTHDATCWYRNCSDGDGHFGNPVDSGCVVVMPIVWLPAGLREKISTP